jgi:hypothetical protein
MNLSKNIWTSLVVKIIEIRLFEVEEEEENQMSRPIESRC